MCLMCALIKLGSDDNVVDWNVYQLDEETDEAHDAEANCGCNCNLLEFCNKKNKVLILKFINGNIYTAKSMFTRLLLTVGDYNNVV